MPGEVYFVLGQWDEAEGEWDLYSEATRKAEHILEGFALRGLLELSLARDDLSRAKEISDQILANFEAPGFFRKYAPLLVELYCRTGDLENASVQVARARKQMAEVKNWRGIEGNFHLSEALLATAQGRWQEAEAAFEKAIKVYRKYKIPYYEGRTRMEQGGMYLARNGSGDREHGIQTLGEALGIFERIQSKKMVEKVLALRKQAESQPELVPAYPDGLTPREVEVLRLIAAGKTDREIAGELVISVTTVSTHVRNLLNKTNVANRSEAVAYAARHGLV